MGDIAPWQLLVCLFVVAFFLLAAFVAVIAWRATRRR